MDQSNVTIFEIMNGFGDRNNNQVQPNHDDLNMNRPTLETNSHDHRDDNDQGYRRRHFKSAVVARTPRIPIIAPPSPPPRDIDQLKMRFLFEKQLQISDVNATGRIVIPKKLAEQYLPPLDSKEGIWLHIDDMDFLRVWTLKFRYWPNNSSRMYVLENTRGLVATHKLEADDYVMIFKDDDNESYVIRIRKYVRNGSQIPAIPYIDYNSNLQIGNNEMEINQSMINEYGNYEQVNPIDNNSNISVELGFNSNPMEFPGSSNSAGAQPEAPEFGQFNDDQFLNPDSFMDFSFFGL